MNPDILLLLKALDAMGECCGCSPHKGLTEEEIARLDELEDLYRMARDV